MWTKHHALISLVAAPFLTILVFGGIAHLPLWFNLSLFGLAVAAGTLIDLDHFLISRYRLGNWRDLKKVLKYPGHYMKNQDRIFSENAVKSTDRTITHFLVILILGLVTLRLEPGRVYSTVNFVMFILNIHMVCDFYADYKHRWFS